MKIMIVIFVFLLMPSLAYGLPFGDNRVLIGDLGMQRLRFLGDINFRGYNLSNIGFLCLSNDCRNVWPNGSSASSPLWFNGTGYIYPNSSYSNNINTTGEINATRFNGNISCANIDGGSDANFCADATVGGGGTVTSISQGTGIDLNPDTITSSGSVAFDTSWGNSQYIQAANEATLNVNSSNSTSWWAGLIGWVSGWFVKNGNSLDLNETKLNQSIDARIFGTGGGNVTNVTITGTTIKTVNITNSDGTFATGQFTDMTGGGSSKWINGTNSIYPDSSNSNNVNITGNLIINNNITDASGNTRILFEGTDTVFCIGC